MVVRLKYCTYCCDVVLESDLGDDIVVSAEKDEEADLLDLIQPPQVQMETGPDNTDVMTSNQTASRPR